MLAGATPQTVTLFDSRPFFEKALVYGLQHGILSDEKIAAMQAEAPKGLVQIARYFGSEFLRPELERARERFVNLVSLQLEHSCGGDLAQAARQLNDHSLLSRSKGGSDMLKALIAMPQSSHFSMHDTTGFTDEHIGQLAKWSLRSLADYRTELDRRMQVAVLIDAAVWFAEYFGLDDGVLQESGRDAEAVLRTALLMLATSQTEMPNWMAFQRTIGMLRKRVTAKSGKLVTPLPKGLPAQFRPVVDGARATVLADLPKILDSKLEARKLFDQTPAFMGRYFWIEDALSEVDEFDRTASTAWHKATAGHSDDSSLLTLFLCLAAGSAPKTLLTPKTAATLVRKIRKAGLTPELVSDYILAHAPVQYRDGYLQMWSDFLDDAQAGLLSDRDADMRDAMAVLRRDCNLTSG